MPKKYQEAVEYERKLKRVMDRMKAVERMKLSRR